MGKTKIRLKADSRFAKPLMPIDILLLVPTLLRWKAFSGVLRPGIFIISADDRHTSFTKPLIPIDMWGLLTLLPREMDCLFREVWQSGFSTNEQTEIRNSKLNGVW